MELSLHPREQQYTHYLLKTNTYFIIISLFNLYKIPILTLNKCRFHVVNKVISKKKKKENLSISLQKPIQCNTVHDSRYPLHLQLPQDCRYVS